MLIRPDGEIQGVGSSGPRLLSQHPSVYPCAELIVSDTKGKHMEPSEFGAKFGR